MTDTTTLPPIAGRRWRALMLLVGVGIGFLSLLAVAFNLHSRNSPAMPQRPPKLIVERELHIGGAELHSPVDAKFTVVNGGDSPLVVHEALAGCRCQGVYVVTPGSPPAAFRDIVISPGASEILGVRFVAGGSPGVRTGIQVTLSSNDPDEPTIPISITFVPTARLYFVPQTLTFGTVLPGQSAGASLEVFDDGRQEKIDWEHIACEPADVFSVAFTPAPKTRELLGGSVAAPVGSLRVTLRAPSTAGPVNDTLILIDRGKEVHRVAVSARSAREVEVVPAVVVLPRRSGGKPVYTARLLCRSNIGPITLQLAHNQPPSFGVAIEKMEPGAIQVLTVAYTGPPVESVLSQSIEVVASSREKSVVVRFDIRIEPEPPAEAKR